MNLRSSVEFRCGQVCKNRVALAPLTNLQSHDDGVLSDAELRWLEARAQGGFGLVSTCAAHVARDGQGWKGELGVFDDALLPGLTKLATTIRSHGALAITQLFHGGVRAPSAVTGSQPWSASVFSEDSPGFETPRAGTSEDIARVIVQFRDAAVRCVNAGFNGVELHGAHGYLLSQFLSRTFNQRTDDWGGDFAHRARLMLEVVRAVRTAVPPSFIVGIRISPEDFGYARGLDLDENLELAGLLSDAGIDFLHLSLWKAADNTKKRPTEHPISLFRKVLRPDVRIITAGTIWTVAEATKQLELGADMVALGRAAICNPDWPAHIDDPNHAPTRPPISREALRERALSDTFIDYLKRWKGFIAE